MVTPGAYLPGRQAVGIARRRSGTRFGPHDAQGVRGSSPLRPTRRSSRFTWGLLHVSSRCHPPRSVRHAPVGRCDRGSSARGGACRRWGATHGAGRSLILEFEAAFSVAQEANQLPAGIQEPELPSDPGWCATDVGPVSLPERSPSAEPLEVRDDCLAGGPNGLPREARGASDIDLGESGHLCAWRAGSPPRPSGPCPTSRSSLASRDRRSPVSPPEARPRRVGLPEREGTRRLLRDGARLGGGARFGR